MERCIINKPLFIAFFDKIRRYFLHSDSEIIRIERRERNDGYGSYFWYHASCGDGTFLFTELSKREFDACIVYTDDISFQLSVNIHDVNRIEYESVFELIQARDKRWKERTITCIN